METTEDKSVVPALIRYLLAAAPIEIHSHPSGRRSSSLRVEGS